MEGGKDIVFFLLGNGARKDALVQQAKELGLDNVIFGDERVVSDVPSLIARADVCFAAVRPEPYPKKVISVKVFEYLACEKPVVGALSGESARILVELEGGIVVPPWRRPWYSRRYSQTLQGSCTTEGNGPCGTYLRQTTLLALYMGQSTRKKIK